MGGIIGFLSACFVFYYRTFFTLLLAGHFGNYHSTKGSDTSSDAEDGRNWDEASDFFLSFLFVLETFLASGLRYHIGKGLLDWNEQDLDTHKTKPPKPQNSWGKKRMTKRSLRKRDCQFVFKKKKKKKK
jgi:hypothetical protein